MVVTMYTEIDVCHCKMLGPCISNALMHKILKLIVLQPYFGHLRSRILMPSIHLHILLIKCL